MKRLIIPVILLITLMTLSACKQEENPEQIQAEINDVKTGIAVVINIENKTKQMAGFAKAENTATEEASETTEAQKTETVNSSNKSTAETTSSSDQSRSYLEIDFIIAAVMLDKEDRIVNCAIDSIPVSFEIDDKGQILTPLEAIFRSKQSLGEKYNMKKASLIGKEWDEQATALSNYVIGKNRQELNEIAVTNTGAPKDVDLTGNVTISIAPHLDVIKEAMDNAEFLGAKSDESIGISGEATIKGSQNAAKGKNGMLTVEAKITALTLNNDKVITTCFLEKNTETIPIDSNGHILIPKKETNKIDKMEDLKDIIKGRNINQIRDMGIDESILSLMEKAVEKAK